MNNSFFQWVALTATVIGGTVYIDEIKADGLVTRANLNTEIQLRIQQYGHIKETLDRIEKQTAGG